LKFTTLEHEFIKQGALEFPKKIKFNAQIRHQVIERATFAQQRGIACKHQMQTVKRLANFTIIGKIALPIEQSSPLKDRVFEKINLIKYVSGNYRIKLGLN